MRNTYCFALLFAFGALLAACESAGPAAPRGEVPLLSLRQTLTGALFTPNVEPTGLPRPGSTPPAYRPFVNPVSAAISASDVYVADAAARTIYRYDLAMNIMAPLKGAAADTATRLRIGPDQSVYALDIPRRRVVQYARNGQTLATFSDVNLSRPVDVAVEENGSAVLVADGVYRQLVGFHPLGRGSFLVPLKPDGRNRVMSVGHIALAADALYVSDLACACVARVARDGTILETFGHQELAQPGPIAADRYGQVFVADQLDASIKVYRGGRLVHTFAGRAAGITQVSDLALNGATLVVADAAGSRVHLIQINHSAKPGG